ncbi:DUF2753 domain-containing protein [Aliivibrio salmonicida]|uniref:DUF2753 domain-containing protein n=1 Tax=Aliivibrio salmonicida TaxID=40269 RepID=UPI003D0E85C8
MIELWEKHTILAEQSFKNEDFWRTILHYQQAYAISEELSKRSEGSLADKTTISIISCHNLAQFWRSQNDNQFELKYLQIASEKALALVPQCPRSDCESFISNLGCCKNALLEFIKRHPNPAIARHIQHIDHTVQCELIASFKLQ